jgi:hypothetical protein
MGMIRKNNLMGVPL